MVQEKQLEKCDGLIVTLAYGHSADTDALRYYVEKHNLCLVEDFAQAMGGYYQEKNFGQFWQGNSYELICNKEYNQWIWGCHITDDPEVYQKCLYVRGDNLYDYYQDIIPSNYRITDIQAAIGIVQLEKIDKMVALRRNIAAKLTILLRELDVKTPVEKIGIRHDYYKYHIILPEYVSKPEFITEMADEKIAVCILYVPPLHKTLVAKNKFGLGIYMPVSENIAPKVVSLPIYPEMPDEDTKRVYTAVKKVVNNFKFQNERRSI